MSEDKTWTPPLKRHQLTFDKGTKTFNGEKIAFPINCAQAIEDQQKNKKKETYKVKPKWITDLNANYKTFRKKETWETSLEYKFR